MSLDKDKDSNREKNEEVQTAKILGLNICKMKFGVLFFYWDVFLKYKRGGEI